MSKKSQEPDLGDGDEMAAFAARQIGSSETATFVVGVNGTIVSWSPEAERLFGRPAWAALGRPCHEVVAACFTDGTPACTAGCPIRLESRLGIAPASLDLVAKLPFRGEQPRRLRVHHVALLDPLGYVAGLLHLVDPDRAARKPANRSVTPSG